MQSTTPSSEWLIDVQLLPFVTTDWNICQMFGKIHVFFSQKWEQKKCGYTRTYQHYGAGCYRYDCREGRLWLGVLNGTSEYPCYGPGQRIRYVWHQLLTLPRPICHVGQPLAWLVLSHDLWKTVRSQIATGARQDRLSAGRVIGEWAKWRIKCFGRPRRRLHDELGTGVGVNSSKWKTICYGRSRDRYTTDSVRGSGEQFKMGDHLLWAA